MRAILNGLILLALVFSLSGCAVALPEIVVMPLISYAAVEFAKPVMDPVITKILATLGVRRAQAAEFNTTPVEQSGVEDEWRQVNGGTLGYSCPYGTERNDCIARARNAANTMAQRHGERFAQAYNACQLDNIEHGTGDEVRSLREINQCTAAKGFGVEMAMLAQAAGGT